MDISSPVSSESERAVEALIRHVRTAADLGASKMVIHPGYVMEPGEEPKRYEVATRSLEEICRPARGLGVTICVENLFSRGDRHLFCDTLPKVLHLVRSVDGVDPGICVDTSHANIMGDVSEAIEICGKAVCSTHISDNRGSDDDHLPPGDGVIDWNAVLSSFDRTSYGGPLTLEVAGRGKQREVLRAALSYLSGFLSAGST
jgi:sugar phosphate isomerase/epimerase